VGRGILVAGGGLRLVVAPASGRLGEILLDVGNAVRRDQVVARIDRPDVADELAEAQSRLAELHGQNERLDAMDVHEKEVRESLTRVQVERLGQEAEFARKRIERLGARRDIVAELVSGGMMTEIERHKVDEEIERARLELEQAVLEIQQIEADTRKADFERQRERMKRGMQLEELQGTVAMLRARLERESQVVSRFDGRVVEVRAAAQTAVAAGDPILLVEPAGAEAGELEAILYVSAATGKRIQEGMEVHVSPTTVKREEFGSMVGRVSFIADVPTSRSAMLAVLSDQDLVDQFIREIGLPLQMRVALERDLRTISGYRWTSSAGPPLRISAGTLCGGEVTVEEQPPLDLVIPLVRSRLGVR
jgi:HlyD family secretion protein